MSSQPGWVPLVESWAEDLFLHGHDLARWITDYVDLEESLAVGSMSQEDLAHAAALWSGLDHDPEWRDQKVYRSDPTTWCPSRLCASRLREWPDTVVRGLLVAEGALTLLEHLCEQTEPLRHVAEVLAAEQRLHAHHWQRWVRLLSRDPATREEFTKVLADTCAVAGDLFGAQPGPTEVDGERREGLHATWSARVRSVLTASGVEPPQLPPRSARAFVDDHSPLIAILEGARGVRTAHPDWNYEVVD